MNLSSSLLPPHYNPHIRISPFHPLSASSNRAYTVSSRVNVNVCGSSATTELRVHAEDVQLRDDEAAEMRTQSCRKEKRKKTTQGTANVCNNAEKFDMNGYDFPCSLGVDLGDARTGIAVSTGFAPRPLSVISLRGQKLEDHLLQLADREKADEFIIGLPKSQNGKETHQSNKVRSFAGRFATRAAERGWRVYLHDEYGTSEDALSYMIDMGSTRRSRRLRLDAYAAVILLRLYFSHAGKLAEIVVPKKWFSKD